MTKRQRIYVADRDRVKKYLRDNIFCKHTREPLARAEAHARNMLVKYIEEAFPERDMKILRKYDKATTGKRVGWLTNHGPSNDRWICITLDVSVITPCASSHYDGDHELHEYVECQRELPLYKPTKLSVEAVRSLRKIDEEAAKEVLGKYLTFVAACSDWESLVEIVPEVAHLRPPIYSKCQAVVPVGLVEDIKQNQRERGVTEDKATQSENP